MSTTPSTTVEISARDFADLVRPMMRLADTGYTLPILCAVRFHSHKGYLIATATDRYVIGFHRRAIEAPEGIEAVISLESLRHILTVFKSTRAVNPDLTITFGAERVTVSVPTLGEALSGELSWPLVPGEYPKVGAILDGKAGTEGSTTAVNPSFLARFAGIGDRAEPMVITVRENGVNVIRIGDDFIGGIMSVRFAGERAESAAWEGFTSPPVVEKKAQARTKKAAVKAVSA